MNFRRFCTFLLVISILTSILCPAAVAEEDFNLAIEAPAFEIIEAEESAEAAPAGTGSIAEATADAAIEPAAESSFEPTAEPSGAPALEATPAPAIEPTAEPTAQPTAVPAVEPTIGPTPAPSVEPTSEPTIEPTIEPTLEPTAEPSIEPTVEPTVQPTATPDPAIVQEIIPEVNEIILGKGEQRSLPAYRLVPETAADDVEYRVPGGLSIGKTGLLKAEKTGTYSLILSSGSGASVEIPVTVKEAPKKISLSADRKRLCAGETLYCALALPDGSAGSVTYTVNKPQLLRDNGDGSFTALAKGSARITAKSYNGKASYLNITIDPAPASLMLSSSSLILAAGESHNLTASLSKGSQCAVSFSSSDASIAAVDEEGRICALQTGEAVITAESCNGLTAQCSVSIRPAPEAILLSADKTLLGVKESAQLSAAFQPEGSGSSMQFSSSKPKVAKVDAYGNITAVSAGTTVISASTSSGVSASIEITVKKAPSKLSLSADKTLAGLGESLTISAVLPMNSAGSVEFSCSNGDILRHDGEGRFTAVGTGTTVITAKSYNGKSASLRVEVVAAPEAISLNASSITLGAQDSFSLAAGLNAGSAGAVRFTSSDSSVAAVDASGRITALKPGEAIITAESYNGLTAECAVTIVPAPEQILLRLPRETIGVKESIPLEVILLPEGSAAGLSYSVKAASAASISSDGMITGLRESRPVITVTTHNGLSAKIELEIDKAPRSITLTLDRNNPAIGETIHTSISLPNYTAGATSLATDRSDVLEIHADGSVTAIGPGTATLTAAAYNGVSASETITVLPMPEEIFLPASMQMGLSTSDLLRASLPAETASAIYFESLNPEIVQAGSGGALRALALGSAVIRATAVNSGASAECTINVLPLPEQIIPDSASVTLLLGQNSHIDCSFYPAESYSKLTYSPADSRIVGVDAYGMLTALKPGTTAVTVKTANGLSAAVQVTVPKAPDKLTLSDSILYLMSDESHPLSCSMPAGAMSIITYSSSNPEIASVDAQTGLITAHATGTACITARALNGVHASCVVNVNIEEEIELSESDGLKVIFMDIGRNDGIIISCGGEYAFFDSGIYQCGQQAVEYMKSLGITRLKYYVGTHAHQDHVGGAGPILDAFDVDMIIAPHDYVIDVMDHFCKTDSEEQAVASTPVHIMKPGEQLYIGGARLSCIGPITCIPHSYHNTSENNNSLVLRLTYGITSFLLTGDASKKEMMEIEENNPGSTQVDVFKNPHHNGYLPMEVIEKVRPKIVVFSTSNRARPKSRYTKQFEELGSEMYITAPAEHSHVTITSDGTNLSVTTASTPKPK